MKAILKLFVCAISVVAAFLAAVIGVEMLVCSTKKYYTAE